MAARAEAVPPQPSPGEVFMNQYLRDEEELTLAFRDNMKFSYLQTTLAFIFKGRFRERYSNLTPKQRRRLPRYIGAAVAAFLALMFLSTGLTFLGFADKNDYSKQHNLIASYVHEWSTKYYLKAEDITIVVGGPQTEKSSSTGITSNSLSNYITMKSKHAVSQRLQFLQLFFISRTFSSRSIHTQVIWRCTSPSRSPPMRWAKRSKS